MKIVSILISIIALTVSYFSFKESKKARIESSRAFLSMDLIQTSEGLYVVLRNIGKTCAYDVNVFVSANFVNGFENLSTIQPDSVYRFMLLQPQNVSNYPETVTFTIQYRDYYSQKRFVEKSFKFNIINSLKYDIEYNKNLNCYDIKKSF